MASMHRRENARQTWTDGTPENNAPAAPGFTDEKTDAPAHGSTVDEITRFYASERGADCNADQRMLARYEKRYEFVVKITTEDYSTVETLYAASETEAIERMISAHYLDMFRYAHVDVIAQGWRPLFMFELRCDFGPIIRRWNSHPAETNKLIWTLAADVNHACELAVEKFGRNRVVTIHEVYPDDLFSIERSVDNA